MKLKIIAAGAAAGAAAVALHASSASAGIYTDDLSRCLLKSTTTADQTNLIIWVFAAMSDHPELSRYVNFTAAEHEAHDRTAALTMQRLLTEDCRTESVAAIKFEGAGSLEAAFTTLGEVAMRGIMSNPGVASGIKALDKYIDAKKFEALARDAGYQPPSR